MFQSRTIRIVCAVVAGLVFNQFASAAFLQNVEYVNLGTLVGPDNDPTPNAIQADSNGGFFDVLGIEGIGTKRFSDFSLVSTATGGALPVDPYSVLIKGGVNPLNNDHVLDFTFGMGAITGQTADMKLVFKITIIQPDVQDQEEELRVVFKDFGLKMLGTAVTGKGSALIGEDVLKEHPFVAEEGDLITHLQVAETQEEAILFDHYDIPNAAEADITEVWVVKDLFVSGDGGGTASISNMIQVFSQDFGGGDIPEPASMALLGLGGLLVCSRKRRA